VHRLSLSWLGLSGATSIPAVPFILSELPGTILNLLRRANQLSQAVDGLSTVWTIGETTETAYTFMGMGSAGPSGRAADPRTRLFLDKPEQFAMSWTTLGGIQANATRDWLRQFAGSLADPAEATRQFWPTIARFGLPYNLIILQSVGTADRRFKEALAGDWTAKMEQVWQAGNLYVIDMTFFASFPANVANARPRFTPGTLTVLARDPATRAIAPFAVRVSDSSGATMQYGEGDPAWLYALQAAKTSVTVWGIWLGHVYHWHIVTAAMQMTMFRHLPRTHPVYQAFGRQSDYLIGFDQFLLLDWSIAPPTSVTSSKQFLEMMDAFAKGRNFFDDDPDTTLERQGLRKQDFTTGIDDWNEYPVVRYLLALFEATSAYVAAIVEAFYPDDASVAADTALQQWIAASGSPSGGNVRGLPAMTTRAALKRVLTSLIYRVTAHGASRLNQGVNPAISFVANFPPCLQDTTLPPARTPIVFKTGGASPAGAMSLAGFLPNTGSIGELATFAFTFIYSAPYKPFIPLAGIDRELPFVGPPGVADVCNQALIRYRTDLRAFMTLYAAESGVPGPPAQLNQWELSIET
jgi:lipoxygenase